MKGIFKVLGLGTVLVLGLTALQSSAQQPESQEAPQILVSESEALGQYLTDGEGRTLYIFLEDEVLTEPYEPVSTCTDECAQNWPPFITEVWPLPEGSIGEGVDANLLEITVRDDNTTQLAYNHWPLYYFAHDENPGDVLGQDFGDNWSAISPEGDPIILNQDDNGN